MDVRLVQRSGEGKRKSLKDESLFIKWLRVLCALVSNTKCGALSLLGRKHEYKWRRFTLWESRHAPHARARAHTHTGMMACTRRRMVQTFLRIRTHTNDGKRCGLQWTNKHTHTSSEEDVYETTHTLTRVSDGFWLKYKSWFVIVF